MSDSSQSTILLLTGAPGIGKTTLMCSVAVALSPYRISGFYTKEIRSNMKRKGFRLIGFDGFETTIAHVDYAGAHRVGRYGVNVNAIDGAAEALLRLDSRVDFFLVDEIGKMECLSSHFILAMRRILDSNTSLFATISKTGSGFIQEVKNRNDVCLWELSLANRDIMTDKVVQWMV